MQTANTHNKLLTLSIAALLGLLCLVGNTTWAQTPITTPSVTLPTIPNDDDTIVGGTDDLIFSSKIPMAGNPTVNRLIGLQTYDEPYSHLFCEIEWLFGGETTGAGFNFAYVPKHFGAYMSLMADEYDPWFTIGAVWRPFTKPAGLDWQIYGGPAFTYGIGYEVGTRFSANAKGNFSSAWSWISGSLGVITINGTSYTTLGISLGIISLSPILLL